MNEGDTMQLGGSSRVYRLHWVPLSRAYDMENQFPLDVSGPVEEGGGGGTDQVRVFFFSLASIGLKCRVAAMCLYKFLTHIFFSFRTVVGWICLVLETTLIE